MNAFDRLVMGIIVGLVITIGIVIGLGDHVGVVVTDFTPGDEQTPPVTTTIRVTFSQPMNTASIEGRFSIEPQVDGQFRWEGNTLIFRPDRALVPGQRYTVTLEAGAESVLKRQTFRQLIWSFVPRLPGVLYLAPADSATRSLWLVLLDGSPARQFFAPEHGIYDFAASPDGSRIAVTVYDQNLAADIWLIDGGGGNPHRITDCQGSFCGGPAWSPDGKLLAYERQETSQAGSGEAGRVWLYDLATGQSAPVFEDSQVSGFGPAWSPDGGRLAFFDAASQGIRVLDLSTGDAVLLPSLMGEVGSFSPDGTQIAFTDIRQVGRQYFPEIMLAQLKPGGSLLPMLDEAQEDQAPAWSPDGQWIAFGRRLLNRQQGWAIQLMLYNPASGELRQVTADRDYNNTLFAWSPAGDALLIQRFDLATSFAAPEIWVYRLGNDSLTRLADNGVGGRWLP